MGVTELRKWLCREAKSIISSTWLQAWSRPGSEFNWGLPSAIEK